MGKKTSYRLIGSSGVTRRAASYTPASAIIIRQFTAWLKRVRSPSWELGFTNSVGSITWEIRTGAGTIPDSTAASLKASGTFDYRHHGTPFKEDRLVRYTVNLTKALTLVGAVRYWFILKIPGDVSELQLPLAWADTYNDDWDNTKLVAYYSGGWSAETEYNLELSILDAQAGVNWHMVLNGYGYMTPDKLGSYQCTQAVSSLAQSRGGQAEWSQLRYPYTAISQDDWSSGAGQLTMKDPHAFLYSVGLDTTVPRQAILGPQVYRTGTETVNAFYYEPHAVHVRSLPDDSKSTPIAPVVYMAQKVIIDAEITAAVIAIRIGRMPYPARHTVQLALYSDAAGSPSSLLDPPGWCDVDEMSSTGVLRGWVEYNLADTVLAVGTYWLVARTDQGWGYPPEYAVLFDKTGSAPNGVAKYSSNGTTWTPYTDSMMYRMNRGKYDALNGDVVSFAYGTVNSNDRLYAAAGKKVYYWNETTRFWIDDSTDIGGAGVHVTAANITEIAIFNGELFVGIGWANNARVQTGGTWGDAGQTLKWFGIGKGYLYGVTSGNNVKYYNGVAWSAAITVGEDIYWITSICNYSGKLLVGKEDGIWEVTDGDLAREFTLFRSEAYVENCEGMCVWSGMLFVPVMNELRRWVGSSYRVVGPTDRNSGVSSKAAWKIDDMWPAASLLWAAGTQQTGKGGTFDGFGGLFAYNGLGWHYLAQHSRWNRNNKVVYVTSELGDEIRIWYAEGSYVSYVAFPLHTSNRYDWMDATYCMYGGYLVISWIDSGLKDAVKFWNRVAIIADVPADTFIMVYMARDGEDWESTFLEYLPLLGIITPDTLDDNGETVLMFPDNLVAKSIQLIFVLHTNDNSKTPRLKAYNLETVSKQQPGFVHTLRIALSDRLTKLDTTTEETRTGQDMWVELQTSAMESAPIVLSLPFMSIRGTITNLTMGTARYKTDDGGSYEWERVGVVSFLELI